MKLIMAIVNNSDSNNVQTILSTNGFYATKLATTGGFLRSGNTTLIIGVQDEHIEKVLDILRENCKKRSEYISPSMGLYDVNLPVSTEIIVGGATVFVLNIERFEKV